MADAADDPRGTDAVRAQVRRVDERLGLAVARLPLSARTLVSYTRDHVAVRTPSRPNEPIGNSLDLLSPPRPDEVGRWVDRFQETVGRLGSQRLRLRWEVPLTDEPEDPPPGVDEQLAAALASHGLRVERSVVRLLEQLAEVPDAPAELVPVDPPAPGRRAIDRRWHAATVLYRYATGSTPDEWRDWDQDRVAWKIEVQRELAAAGRAKVWLALRHGAPVGRLTVHHDRQGLAGVDDLVVHPAHRRLGIGAALTRAAIAAHRRERPEERIGVEVAPAGPSDRLARRLGLAPHATILSACGDGAGEAGG
jgi:GNAT superfamily N-acetyltransferase